MSNRLLFCYILSVCDAVHITKVIVPTTYILDDESAAQAKPLILDCLYEMEKTDTGLVLKWLLNNQAVYQWIPSSKPYAMMSMKNRLDLSYEASSDEKLKYRAMVIVKPTWNMTGQYSCSIQTFQSSVKQSANLTVIGE